MNKQQLASKIWETANKMRSKIEANEYKDYILGFIFYKFLSEKEERTLSEMGFVGDMSTIEESNSKIVKAIQQRIGYFISYNNLFSTWITKGKDFKAADVREALSAFDRLIDLSHKKVFEKIFETLQTGLSKLGETSGAQDIAVRDLAYLINDIPMTEKQDYDVLGFIYEYLISNFAANAGKKAGEFYTPHEVSVLMSDIIASHLKGRENIQIYDPTSGSGSLLINIGNSVDKYVKNENSIRYYAQELKQNTFNLTRMNLIMRGILPNNIVVRNGDTLEEDWPFFDENHEYEPLFVDAVVSNPPYSQSWEVKEKEYDARFKSYGIAPKSKADYAFLLHDLYHLKSDGIMTIVLPHGVLFRGGEEGEIRKNLIEKNNIDAIIGLPANIFFGTPIPTIIMVLKKQKTSSDIQIIDASKGFIKEGKNNKLRACDIKKIADAIMNRENIDKFSKVVPIKEIRKNDYNLNIPRYVDSSEPPESFDIYASMFGGIPKYELEQFKNESLVFTNLRNQLFKDINKEYCEINCDNVAEIIKSHEDIKKYNEIFNTAFADFGTYLKNELIDKLEKLYINSEENTIALEIFNRMNKIPLIDKYKAYQILDNHWNDIAGDVELIQKEGIGACNQVDPLTQVKKKNGKDEEVQVGWKGHIISFELVQKYKMQSELDDVKSLAFEIEAIESEIQGKLDSRENIDDINSILNDNNDEFDYKEIEKRVKDIKKNNEEMNEINLLMIEVNKLNVKIKELKKKQKTKESDLQASTKKCVEKLSVSEIEELLYLKWIEPIEKDISNLVNELINDFIKKVEYISSKYTTTLIDLEKEIQDTEKSLSSMLDELTGSEFDMKGLNEFKSLLCGEKYGE